MREFFQGIYAAARDKLRKARDSAELKAVTAGAHNELDELFDEGMIHTRAAIACCAGCSYCCYLKVDARPAEIFLIVDKIKRELSETQQAEILQKAESNRELIEPMTSEQHMGANLACPLLHDGRCSVYSSRPASCRMFHAQTVQTCKESYDEPSRMDLPDSQIPQLKMVLGVAHTAVGKAHEDAGFDSRPYDLNLALIHALKDARHEKRWRDRKTAFPRSALAKSYVEQNRG